jgi:hypothetical protein
MKPCAVPLCPAFARLDSPFCAAHRHAKKLPNVSKGWTCKRCHRVLHAGDYVTLESEIGNFEHAECPKPQPRTPRGVKGATPLFNEPRPEKRL